MLGVFCAYTKEYKCIMTKQAFTRYVQNKTS